MKAIDLFAGAGGFTEGAKLGGANVVWAGNHWRLAVDIHAANHPETIHACQDLKQADWTQIPAHDIGLASPSCKGHTKARGKEKLHHDSERATAWAVVDCAECHRQPVWIVENTLEFKDWVLFPVWKDAMARLGYSIAEYVIDAADLGVPQNRVRLFLIATISKSPIKINIPQRQHKPISEVIQWDEYKWSLIDKPGRSKNTLARISAGRRLYGDRFVAPYYGSGSGKSGRSINRPVGTITTVDRWAVINGDKMRMMQPPEVRLAMGFRPSYILPGDRRSAIHLMGNAVCPAVPEHLIKEVRRVA